MSMSSWLRREDTPLVRDSVVSESPTSSRRIFADRASSARIALDAVKGSSATSAPLAPPGAGAGAAASAAGAAAGAGAGWAGAAGAAGGASTSSSSSSSMTATSVRSTRASSRWTLKTSVREAENSGCPSVRAARFASVGAAPRPTSTTSSTARPWTPGTASPEDSSTRCVSIQRTGEANCQHSSSMRSVRVRRPGSAAAASHAPGSSSRRRTSSEGTTSRIDWANSRVSSKGRATRFGM